MTLFMKTLSALGLVGLAVILGRAQGNVNFSGTLILNKSQSDVSQLMATSDAPEKVRNASMTMVVEQEGSNLRVTRILKIAAEEKSAGQLGTSNFRSQTTPWRNWHSANAKTSSTSPNANWQ